MGWEGTRDPCIAAEGGGKGNHGQKRANIHSFQLSINGTGQLAPLNQSKKESMANIAGKEGIDPTGMACTFQAPISV